MENRSCRYFKSLFVRTCIFDETISNDTQQNYYLNGIVVPDPPLKNTDTGGRKYVDYNNPVYYFTFNQNINYNTVGGGVTETVSSGVTTRTYGFGGPGVSTIAGSNVSAVSARIVVETKVQLHMLTNHLPKVLRK